MGGLRGLSRNMRALDQHLLKQERDERRQRARQAPIGEGTHLRDCVECGRPFRANSTYAVLCGPCDADDAARYNEEPEVGRSYNYQSFKRGGFR
jgi:hypothetical protein